MSRWMKKLVVCGGLVVMGGVAMPTPVQAAPVREMPAVLAQAEDGSKESYSQRRAKRKLIAGGIAVVIAGAVWGFKRMTGRT